MAILMVFFFVLVALFVYLVIKYNKLLNENEKLKYELQRTMKLVNQATSQGFKL